jgi:hemerythrin
MALIQWNNNLSVNVRVIDSQHQKLIQLINDLHEAMRLGKGKDASGIILSELARYAIVHFSTEETYFEKFRYPETSEHKAEHNKFVKDVSEFKKGFDEGRLDVSVKLLNFLSDWLKNHIKITDKKYAPFFNQNGLI